MNRSVWPRCGGPITSAGNGHYECKYCRFHLPESITNEEVTLLYNANQQLRIGNFEEAESLFRDLTERYPNSSEAFNSSFLYHGYYWTRSPYTSGYSVAWVVRYNGTIEECIVSDNHSVRPAITIRID